MFVVIWYENGVKQISTFSNSTDAIQRAKELRAISDKLKRTSLVPIIVTEEKGIG